MYRKNFNSLDIMAYDIKFKDAALDDQIALVKGDFIFSFKSSEEDRYKKSYGDINWLLSWHGDNWLINEIKYNVTNTKVGDDFNKQY